jgi:hypothetical protein
MKITTLFWRWWYKFHPSTSRYTRPEALAIARKHGLEYEVIKAMDHGCTPDEALQEWDIYPYDNVTKSK